MIIETLTLYTKNIVAQKNFYAAVLELPVSDSQTDSFTVHTQKGTIVFRQNEKFTPYHFAFTIPGESIFKALSWLKKRVSIIKNESEEVVDFPAWNAKSVYFYDEDRNIVEFIARKNLPYPMLQSFDASQLYEVSEIGLATSAFHEKLQKLLNIPRMSKFSGGDEVFAALGSETGLVILIDKGKKNWFPGNDTAFSSEFDAVITTPQGRFQLNFTADTLEYDSKS